MSEVRSDYVVADSSRFVVMANSKDEYSEKEAKARFEAALRGARITGHRPMTDIPKKREVKKTKPEKKPGK